MQYQPLYFAVVNEQALIVREIFEDETEARFYTKKLNTIDHCDHYHVQPCVIVPKNSR